MNLVLNEIQYIPVYITVVYSKKNLTSTMLKVVFIIFNFIGISCLSIENCFQNSYLEPSRENVYVIFPSSGNMFRKLNSLALVP